MRGRYIRLEDISSIESLGKDRDYKINMKYNQVFQIDEKEFKKIERKFFQKALCDGFVASIPGLVIAILSLLATVA